MQSAHPTPSASPLAMLAAAFAGAIAEVCGLAPERVEPHVRAAGDPQFGDYQCNAAMALAKARGLKPRDLAESIKSAVEPRLAGVIAPLEIAGPGFINIRLSEAFLVQRLGHIDPAPAGGVDRVGLPTVDTPQRIVVEYSQPNIAKQMHVGHLRSTIIGDVFARLLDFLGHDVIRQNHIGDWGTQFGMLIRWYREHPLPRFDDNPDALETIEADYRAANERDKSDPEFAREARAAVAELQSGDADARRVWEQICAVSWRAFTDVYERLGVLLKPEDVRGESFYNPKLADVVQALRRRLPDGGDQPQPRAVVRDDAGAVCVFLFDAAGAPRYKTAEGEPLPLIIQKSDGAFLYATTDLAALRFRLHELAFRSGAGAQRVIYVTDARQKLHFEMFLAAAAAAGWIPAGARIDHVTFGSVLGADRKPLKTRAGGTIKLKELIDEAERRALALIEQRAAEAPDDASATPAAEVARRVGVASIKYADLRNDRNTDYVFDWDKMIALQGNTAPYMMYAYARVRSIHRRAAAGATDSGADVGASGATLVVSHPAERALMVQLVRLRETVDAVAAELMPHVLCGYLYELAGEFMKFYEACPVLDAPDAATRRSRMRLCDLTARTLALGLGLLGIDVVERM